MFEQVRQGLLILDKCSTIGKKGKNAFESILSFGIFQVIKKSFQQKKTTFTSSRI